MTRRAPQRSFRQSRRIPAPPALLVALAITLLGSVAIAWLLERQKRRTEKVGEVIDQQAPQTTEAPRPHDPDSDRALRAALEEIASKPIQPPVVVDPWKKLRKGMTPQDVLDTLGPADRMTELGHLAIIKSGADVELAFASLLRLALSGFEWTYTSGSGDERDWGIVRFEVPNKFTPKLGSPGSDQDEVEAEDSGEDQDEDEKNIVSLIYKKAYVKSWVSPR